MITKPDTYAWFDSTSTEVKIISTLKRSGEQFELTFKYRLGTGEVCWDMQDGSLIVPSTGMKLTETDPAI